MPKYPILRSNGFSILEVLIATGLISIIMFALTGFVSQQHKEIRLISQRFDRDSFSRYVATKLGENNLTLCNCHFLGQTFDSSDLSASTSIASIKNICGASTDLVTSGTQVGMSDNNLVVSNNGISIGNFSEISTNFYRSSLKIAVEDPIGNSVALKPSEVAIEFNTTGPNGGVKTITSCSNVIGGGTNITITGQCALGEYVIGIQNNSVVCAPVGALNPALTGSYGLSNRGPGCTGTGCVAADYGPCIGAGCITNGIYCSGTGCKACAAGASCNGTGCCSGTSCTGCSIF